uniref:Homing endonuclease n=1 Tax=Thelephora ganbajun TaxID=370292 RepID=A0A343B738_THEGA|nr:homing endonuclease [Thelephora ganbajun]
MKSNTKFLPGNLHSILIGLMLGDGHIYKTSTTSNSRFEISFGKDRELFADWISNLFKDYSNTGLRLISIKVSGLFCLHFNYRFKLKLYLFLIIIIISSMKLIMNHGNIKKLYLIIFWILWTLLF